MSSVPRGNPSRLNDAIGELERAALAFGSSFARFLKAKASVEELALDASTVSKDELVRIGASLRIVRATMRNALAEGRAARRIKYADYLDSPGWKLTRKEALVRAGFKCQSCGVSDIGLEVHHLTYERLGEELETDLMVLCDRCHERAHGRELTD